MNLILNFNLFKESIEEGKEIKCTWCMNKFIPKSKNQINCSDSCESQYEKSCDKVSGAYDKFFKNR